MLTTIYTSMCFNHNYIQNQPTKFKHFAKFIKLRSIIKTSALYLSPVRIISRAL